jgi:hypothetical protein
MTLAFFDETMRRSEEEFFEAVDKASKVLTVREIATATGSNLSSVECWVARTRAPHPAIRRWILNKIEEVVNRHSRVIEPKEEILQT